MADALRTVIAGASSHMAAMFAGFACSAAPAAIDAIWQGALVVFASVLCLRFMPRVSAAHRFALWISAFAAVAALPFLPFLVHRLSSGEFEASVLPTVMAKPWLQIDSRWGLAVAAVWLVASALRAADLAFHSLRLCRLWKHAVPVEVDTNLRTLAAAVCPTRRAIEICTTRELDRPSVIGFLAPRILIPDWLLERLSPGELDHIVLHELEHLKRRDDWTNLLQKFLLVLFPLNPALAWMERRLCREREMACDEGVVHQTQAPSAYAACLTSLAERSLKRRTQMLSLGVFERRPELVHRVHSILWRGRALHPLAARAWLGAVSCGLLLGALEMARCPEMVGFVPATSSTAQRDVARVQKNYAPAVTGAGALAVSQREAANASAQFREGNVTRAPAQYRAINTIAVLPERHDTRSTGEGNSVRRAIDPAAEAEREVVASTETDAGIPHQTLLKAEAPSLDAAVANKPQMIFFLTAWEQVEVLPENNRQITDYETGAGDRQAEAASGSRPDLQPNTQFRMTRMILAVYPVNPAPQAKAHHSTISNSGQQAAVPFDGGWLVFEL
jgi:beta-lactamase regulating signal transducer with metallopeptidase domain